ncbi:MAG: methylated-DNA--[protein]-cysteine S-methyltransferase [Chloroflexi bacterium]|nr:methylated-DNA--[protein]-cysteine S-methyltransferase [Chloroflexota bacterium]MCH8868281.1 methylated-DNA--[protein]-cysteine S-methyltransferase [Chloroflexota bacterium]MCH9039986.1 methylated-DNA--[protein]-cysteine S-methyltransferase [Chloroflexota bacterium]MCI0770453.1 methylated-DNA--[protein]-cysteine S-methyltransferase [Chloroflexota bacterium]MCI0790624.1 methylated-DNA--[protein]-cysteine S-methyltransferase [Chloroflexota bacterium]
MTIYFDIFETPYGWMGAVASEKGLLRTTLPQPSPEDCAAQLGESLDGAEPDPERFLPLREKVTRYLNGEDVTLADEAIDVEDASPFHQAAWKACRSIPKGETRTYKWLAAQAGKPLAPRAAGQAMARNRLALIIPCHRVVASDGSLRGFGKGASQLGLKQRLLDLENRAEQLPVGR